MIKVMGDTWDAEEHHPAPPPPSLVTPNLPPTTSTHPSSTCVGTSQITKANCQTSLGRHNWLWQRWGWRGSVWAASC